MARPLRIEFPGALYHITSRGNAREPIFLNDSDKKNFLYILCSVVRRFNWLCHSYCLMNNHYHLLIETPEGNLSKGMRQLNGVYTQLFNRKHHRVGHLFQGRYKAPLVDKDDYLVSLSRYIVLNPVRAGLVENPEDWRWSSYRAMIEKDKKIPCLTVDWILSQFDRDRRKAIAKYEDFMREGKEARFPWEALKGQIFLGNDYFVKKMEEFLKGKEEIMEIPKQQRYVARPPLSELINTEKIISKKQRDVLIFNAYTQYGYTMKQIARHLGIHYSTVSRAVRREEKYNKHEENA
ncbi:MAG: transposase [Candidatus Aerophobetes bacterium]|nr:transposase [Candidatus Aerophobetes bacterium]